MGLSTEPDYAHRLYVFLLGTDFPYQPVFKHAIDYIKEGLSEEDAKKILDENAARIFNISKTN